MNVLLLSRYSRLGASSRVRSYQYIPYLEEAGFSITSAPLLGNDYLRRLYSGNTRGTTMVVTAYIQRLRRLLSVSKYDLLWIEKELFPWMPWVEELLLPRLRIPYVVDYDDAVYHRYDMSRSSLVRSTLGKKIDAVMRNASLVTVGNRYLAERAKRAGALKIEVIPSAVDVPRYTAAPAGKEFDSGELTIGWIGTPMTARYLQLIAAPLADICASKNARLVLVGAGPVRLNGVLPETVKWTEETEVQSIRSFDIGIMPLPDSPSARGKCGYKLIQYMACSKPVVASPVGVNKEIVTDKLTGYLARTEEEWAHALRDLWTEPGMRARMGQEGRKRVEGEYSVQVIAPRLAELLRSVVER